jgi:hypothetical protein
VKLNDYPRSFLDQLAGSRLPSLPTRRRCRRAFVDGERLLYRLALSVCRQLFNGRQRHYLIEHAGTDAAESVAGFQLKLRLKVRQLSDVFVVLRLAPLAISAREEGAEILSFVASAGRKCGMRALYLSLVWQVRVIS